MSAPRQPPAACDDRHQLPSRKLGAEFLDAAAGILERLGGGRIGNAEMRTEAEGRAEHHGNTLLFQQRVAEILVVADLHAALAGLADGAGAARVDIEGTLRRRAVQALEIGRASCRERVCQYV